MLQELLPVDFFEMMTGLVLPLDCLTLLIKIAPQPVHVPLFVLLADAHLFLVAEQGQLHAILESRAIELSDILGGYVVAHHGVGVGCIVVDFGLDVRRVGKDADLADFGARFWLI